MAKKTKAAKAGAGAAVAGATPYVQRLLQDEDLRDNIRTAYDSGRTAYGRLGNGKAPGEAPGRQEAPARAAEHRRRAARRERRAARGTERRSARAASGGS